MRKLFKYISLIAIVAIMAILSACSADGGEVDINLGLTKGVFRQTGTTLEMKKDAVVCFAADSTIGEINIKGGQAIKATEDIIIGVGVENSGWFETLPSCPLSQTATGPVQPEAEIQFGDVIQTGGGQPPVAPAVTTITGGNWQVAGYDQKDAAMALCISDQKMMAETGVTRVIDTTAPGDWETCKWQIIPDGQPFNLPSDGRYTGRMSDGNHVLWIGPVQVPPSFEGTLRLARGYVVNSFAQDPCQYAQHEVGYADNLRKRTAGEDNIMYSLGNFNCSNVQGLIPYAGQSMGSAPAIGGAAQCPTSPEDAATQLGGKATYWAQSPDDPTLWVYGSKTITDEYTDDNVKFRYPGYGWFEWWNAPGGKQMLEAFPVDEATFHCN